MFQGHQIKSDTGALHVPCALVFGCWELKHVIFLKLRKKELPYARHYKPWLVFFYPFFTRAAAYTADNVCTKQGNVGLKSAAYRR